MGTIEMLYIRLHGDYNSQSSYRAYFGSTRIGSVTRLTTTASLVTEPILVLPKGDPGLNTAPLNALVSLVQ